MCDQLYCRGARFWRQGSEAVWKSRRPSWGKLQALVYCLPSTTAVLSYVIGSRKLSANEQFFVGAQTVSLLETTQIKQGMSFIAANKVYTSTKIKSQSFESRYNSFFLPGVDASHVQVGAWALGCFHSHISTQTFRRALTASLDSCAEIRVPLQWRN